MARGGPRKADGPSKKGAKATVTILTGKVENHARPELPDPRLYLTPPDPFAILPQHMADHLFQEYPEWAMSIVERTATIEWHPVVIRWWEDVWDSPMAAEFIKSDLSNLHLAAKYLHHSVDPYTKPTDARAYADKFERTSKAYGLDPTARAGLRWTISQGEMGQQRTNQLRERGKQTPEEQAQENNRVADLYTRHGSGTLDGKKTKEA